MTRRARALALALALGAPLVGCLDALGADNPHRFFSDRGQCVRCHVEIPKRGARGGARLKKSVVELCLECHREKDVSALHPVDIRPGTRVPKGLPLDERGAITCATCHDPHGPYEAGQPYVEESLSKRLVSILTRTRKYRTFFLRRPNSAGQLCLACHQKELLATEGFHVKEASVLEQYAGSEACRGCHAEVYGEWRKTPHARMARDVKQEPASVLADFERSPPFPREQVLYALGSHWSQRFVVDKGGKLFVKAAVWSIGPRAWDTSSTVDKPWAEYCQGCHTTGLEMREQPRFVELGVGCEACHGPGRAHARSGGKAVIVNPAKLDAEVRDMICESCHTTGHDRSGQFRFPLGYRPGRDLGRYYKGLLPRPGQDNASFVGDESGGDRHRQWLYWVKSYLDVRNLTCDICRNFRGKVADAVKDKPQMSPSEYCLSCHKDNVPRTDVHRRHADAGVQCHQCHAPRVEKGMHQYSVHDHKFLFREPEATASPNPRESCGRCHRRLSARAGG